jgi:hypothetical protein
MSRKIIFITTLILIAGAFAGIYSYNKFVSPINFNVKKDPSFSIYLENKQKTFEEITDWYEVKIKYPEQNLPAADFIFQEWNNFANEFQLKKYKSREEAKEELGLGDMPEQKYVFNAEYKLVEGGNLFGTSTLTYIFTVYNYTGGAHGGTNVLAYTIDETGKIYQAKDFLGESVLPKISDFVAKDILRQKKERLSNPEQKLSEKEVAEILKDESWIKEGTKPVRENYSVVWPEGDSIVVNFGQYQVGAYAEGMYEVKIPKKMLE